MHIPDPERREWVAAADGGADSPPSTGAVLGRLVRADVFEAGAPRPLPGLEAVLARGRRPRSFPCSTRCSTGAAEGRRAGDASAMSHRGRLNVMVHVVGPHAGRDVRRLRGRRPEERARRRRRQVPPGRDRHLPHARRSASCASTWCRTRAISRRSTRSRSGGCAPSSAAPARDAARRVLPIAACTATRRSPARGSPPRRSTSPTSHGYSVGGAVHVVANNLIGFTTRAARPTARRRYATDVAKRLPIPIFHVNGEDPTAVVRVARIAIEYRYAFAQRRRRRPHRLPALRPQRGGRSDHHAAAALPGDPASSAALEELRRAERARAPSDADGARAATVKRGARRRPRGRGALAKSPVLRSSRLLGRLPRRPPRSRLEVDTGVDAGGDRAPRSGVTACPTDFHVHPKVAKLLEQRRGDGARASGRSTTAWPRRWPSPRWSGGVPVRLSGQDTRRGTFNQRHAVLVDVENEPMDCRSRASRRAAPSSRSTTRRSPKRP